MSQQNGHIEINDLIGEFMDLHEQWMRDPEGFDWSALESLARKGATAYNEGAGPSFHMLALDGVQHGEFHERFLTHSVDAGFDTFKVVRGGNGEAMLPVLCHSWLADAEAMNPSSARMRAFLMELAKKRFGGLVPESGEGVKDANLIRIIEACAESIPAELLVKLMPEMAKRHDWAARASEDLGAVEGRISNAEMIIENNSRVYG